MSRLVHHLAAIGWVWVALFLVLIAIAFTCAASAVSGRKGNALTPLLLAVGVTVTSLLATVAVVAVSFGSTDVATASVDPSQKARVMANGISEAMNGAALGVVTTLCGVLASVVCLVAFLMRRSKVGAV